MSLQKVLPPAPEESNALDRPQCTAHLSDGSGRRCPHYPMHGRTVCYHHGGAMVQSELTAGGKHSKYLPEAMKERFEEFHSRPDWISLREQIALTELRLSQLEESLDGGLSASALKHIVKELTAMRQGFKWLEPGAGEDEDFTPEDGFCLGEALDDLLAFCRDPQRVAEVWADIHKVQDLLRKLKETEVKRMVAANQVLTVTESYTLIQRLASFCEEYIEDLATRALAVRELHKLLNRRGSG